MGLDSQENMFYHTLHDRLLMCPGGEGMIRAHKIRLHPTVEQQAYFARAAGVSRFCWNWALAEWKRATLPQP
ncbi:hypothetical protein KDK_00380 [Dictyobacter kobayashii]|uniref:Transposase putative helix-turn-helix domain-containing protein n=1 Tax=Dictyobacter kobayashii TaxID=2014872 RepID=A0A402AAV7_9CHLR|nr:hypothetical protein KDK_00380 [Dictyobacter kobayashii]